MARAKIRVVVDEIGRGSIFLDDKDLSQMVGGITIATRVGEVTEIALTFIGVACEFEGFMDDTSIQDQFRKYAPKTLEAQ